MSEREKRRKKNGKPAPPVTGISCRCVVCTHVVIIQTIASHFIHMNVYNKNFCSTIFLYVCYATYPYIYIDRERLVHKSVYWQPLNCNFIYHWMAAAWQKRWYGDRKEERERKKHSHNAHELLIYFPLCCCTHFLCVHGSKFFSPETIMAKCVCPSLYQAHRIWIAGLTDAGEMQRLLCQVSFFIYYFSISVNGCCTRYRAHQFSNGRHDQLRCVWMEWNCEKSPELCT